MNYKPFPEDYLNQIKQTLQELKQKNAPIYAAFDADGTLWDTDLGENFFQYQIDQKHISLPPNPWDFYLEMKQQNNDPRAAYAWLAQINKGQTLEQVRQWSQLAFDQIKPLPIFTEQKRIIDILLESNVQIYIVTASIKWAVEPGARALGLSNENVIGVETLVADGIITNEAVFPITYRAGKTEAFLKKTNNVKPFFASGNTSGDIELLQSASHLRLAVSAASRDDKLFKAETELMNFAEKNNWLRHRFI
ncbi:MAG: haloacid dehalogenase-like hydrolase [Pseudobdellovibrio sp.]